MKKVLQWALLFFAFVSAGNTGLCGFPLMVEGVVFDFSDMTSYEKFKRAYDAAQRFTVDEYRTFLISKIQIHGQMPQEERSGGLEIAGVIYGARGRLGQQQVAALLTNEAFFDGDERGVVYESPLLLAAQLNDGPMLRHLLKMANDKLNDEQLKKIIENLAEWITHGSLNKEKLYVFHEAEKAGLSCERRMRLLLSRSYSGATALIAAVKSGDLDIVKKLVWKINKCYDEKPLKPLTWQKVKKNDKDAIADFLRAPVYVSRGFEHSYDALSLAIDYNYVDIVSYLVDTLAPNFFTQQEIAKWVQSALNDLSRQYKTATQEAIEVLPQYIRAQVSVK